MDRYISAIEVMNNDFQSIDLILMQESIHIHVVVDAEAHSEHNVPKQTQHETETS